MNTKLFFTLNKNELIEALVKYKYFTTNKKEWLVNVCFHINEKEVKIYTTDGCKGIITTLDCTSNIQDKKIYIDISNINTILKLIKKSKEYEIDFDIDDNYIYYNDSKFELYKGYYPTILEFFPSKKDRNEIYINLIVIDKITEAINTLYGKKKDERGIIIIENKIMTIKNTRTQEYINIDLESDKKVFLKYELSIKHFYQILDCTEFAITIYTLHDNIIYDNFLLIKSDTSYITTVVENKNLTEPYIDKITHFTFYNEDVELLKDIVNNYRYGYGFILNKSKYDDYIYITNKYNTDEDKRTELIYIRNNQVIKHKLKTTMPNIDKLIKISFIKETLNYIHYVEDTKLLTITVYNDNETICIRNKGVVAIESKLYDPKDFDDKIQNLILLENANKYSIQLEANDIRKVKSIFTSLIEGKRIDTINNNILLSIDNNKLTIQGTDGTVLYKKTININSDIKDNIALNIKKFFNIVDLHKNDTLYFHIDTYKNNKVIVIKNQSGVKHTHTLLEGVDTEVLKESVNEYKYNENNFIKVNKNEFINILKKNSLYINKNHYQKCLTGIYIEKVNNNKIRLVATDGRKLIFNELEYTGIINNNGILSYDNIKAIINACKDSKEEYIQFSITKDYFVLKTDNGIDMINSLVDGEYFEYNSLIPTTENRDKIQLSIKDIKQLKTDLKNIYKHHEERVKKPTISFTKDKLDLIVVDTEFGMGVHTIDMQNNIKFEFEVLYDVLYNILDSLTEDITLYTLDIYNKKDNIILLKNDNATIIFIAEQEKEEKQEQTKKDVIKENINNKLKRQQYRRLKREELKSNKEVIKVNYNFNYKNIVNSNIYRVA